jgi:hypothetical protein
MHANSKKIKKNKKKSPCMQAYDWSMHVVENDRRMNK